MKNIFYSFLFLVLASTSLNAQSYAYTEGFTDNIDGDGWFFSNTSTSTTQNGLYPGDNAIKMNDGAYIQTPILSNSITLSFYYSTKLYNNAMEGTLVVTKSTDDGSTWTEIKTISASSAISYTLDSININETVPCMVRFTYTKVGGLFFIDDIAMTYVPEQIKSDNVEITAITSSCKTVSSEDIIFTEGAPGVFIGHDSIGFDAVCNLMCEPLSANATVKILKSADPLPGTRDTAIFEVTSEDASTTAIYKAIVFKSLYQSKFGFIAAINQNTSSYDNWSFGGKRYPSSSKGNGGTYPGEKAMRIYDSSGSITSPKFSSISTLSFVGKFSKSDGESLVVQKSYDGSTFTEVKTYLPGAEIPSYTTESAADTLSATQVLNIDDEDVYIRFQYINGNSTGSRTMIDDIAIKADYDYTGTHDIFFNVYDFDNMPIEGVTVTLGSTSVLTNANGEASFIGLSSAGITTYSLAKADYTSKLDSMPIMKSQVKNIMLLQEELEIFIALGQSNMAGRAPIATYTDSIEGAYLLDDNSSWVTATNPMNLYSNIRKDVGVQDLGPSYSFTQTMSKYLDKRVCMIVNARGGSSISKFAEGGIYNEALMARVEEANNYGDVKAVIWHQGESNSSSYSSYLSTLDGLVTDIREATNDDFYFVAGQLGPWYDKYKGFNENLVNISSEVSNANYVTNDSLWHRGDSTHFNTISQIVLGQRYAQSVLAEVYSINVAVFNVVIDSNVTVTCGEEVMSTSGSFTPLWGEDSVLTIVALDGYDFESLTINGVVMPAAAGTSSYDYAPNSNDHKMTIVATLKEEATSLDNTSSSSLSYYPNPSSGLINFKGGDEFYTVKLIDLTGREVLSTTCHNSLDVSMLKQGCYVIQLQSGEDTLVRKIILN